MKKLFISLLLSLSVAACGSHGDEAIDLSKYSGTFALTETFNLVQGTSCSEPAVKVFENGVRIKIERNDFEAIFDQRWSTLYGEIHEDKSFLGSKSQTDRRFELTGSFSDVDTLTATLKDVDGSCTRIYDVVGSRALP